MTPQHSPFCLTPTETCQTESHGSIFQGYTTEGDVEPHPEHEATPSPPGKQGQRHQHRLRLQTVVGHHRLLCCGNQVVADTLTETFLQALVCRCLWFLKPDSTSMKSFYDNCLRGTSLGVLSPTLPVMYYIRPDQLSVCCESLTQVMRRIIFHIKLS